MEYQTQPDSPLSPQQQKLAESLSGEFLAAVDKKILETAKPFGRKIAFIVGAVMMDDSLRVDELPDIFYAQRVKSLVNQGLLVSEGNLNYMGYCEVRLP